MQERLKIVPKISALTVAIIGVLVLIGWQFEISLLKSVFPGFVSMKANSAICCVLSGLTLWLLNRKENSSIHQSIIYTCSTIIILVGLITFIEYIGKVNFGCDELIFKDDLRLIDTSNPGRMSPNSALNFILVGLAFLFHFKNFRLTQLFVFIALAIAMFALVGYILNVAELTTFGSYTKIAFPTVICFLLIGIGILFSRTERGFLSVILSEYSGGTIAKPLLLFAIILPIFFGWMQLKGQYFRLYHTAEFGVALLVISMTTIFILVIWWYAKSLNHTDQIRETSEIVLLQLNTHLASTLTDLEKKNDSLLVSEKRLLDAETMAQIGNWSYDMVTQEVLWSDEFFRILGLTPQEFEPQQGMAIKYVHPDDVNLLNEAIEFAVKGGKKYNVVNRIITSKNELKYVRNQGEVSFNESRKPIRMIGTTQDITIKKKAEIALKEQETLRTLSLIQGQEEERKRISRDLHDGLGQLLTAVKINLENMDVNEFNENNKRQDLRRVYSLVKDTIQEVRKISDHLSPASLHDFGLLSAVNNLTANLNASQKNILLSLNSNIRNQRFRAELEINIYRIIQESINNSMKYAKCSNIEINIHIFENSLNVLISDDGIGFDQKTTYDGVESIKSHSGLKNIKERAAILGADVSINSKLGNGTQIDFQLESKYF